MAHQVLSEHEYLFTRSERGVRKGCALDATGLGNRTTAQEAAEDATACDANNLNQYTFLHFREVPASRLADLGISSLYEAPNIWKWSQCFIPKMAAVNQKLPINHLMLLDYYGVLKDSDSPWSYARAKLTRKGFTPVKAPVFKPFESVNVIE